MLTPFSTDELTRLQQAQENGMMDTCVISRYSAGQIDAYGMPHALWTDGAPTACGLNPSAHREVMDGTQVVLTDAVLRLPIATLISALDRITLTHRFGVALGTPLDFVVLGEPMRGPSGLRVNLRTLTNKLPLEGQLSLTVAAPVLSASGAVQVQGALSLTVDPPALSASGTVITILVRDEFTDANGTALTAHTIAPVNEPATDWTAGVGTFQIQSNKAEGNSDADNDQTWCDAGDADVSVSADATPSHTDIANAAHPSLLLRGTDATHNWVTILQSALDQVRIYENTGTGYVERAVGAVALDSGATYAFKAVLSGQTITVYVAEAQVATYGSAASNQAATLFGLRIGKSGVPPAKQTWDNFKVLVT